MMPVLPGFFGPNTYFIIQNLYSMRNLTKSKAFQNCTMQTKAVRFIHKGTGKLHSIGFDLLTDKTSSCTNADGKHIAATFEPDPMDKNTVIVKNYIGSWGICWIPARDMASMIRDFSNHI
jgi:hypothetical protein